MTSREYKYIRENKIRKAVDAVLVRRTVYKGSLPVGPAPVVTVRVERDEISMLLKEAEPLFMSKSDSDILQKRKDALNNHHFSF